MPALRPSTGSNMPKTRWLLYAENRLAPLCRKLGGSITPEDDTATTVEIFFRSARVATHVRSYQRGAHTTIPEHMPKSHRAHAEWSPRRLIQWGESIGPSAGTVVEHLLRSKPHPEQGYRTCLGLLALARQYTEPRFEAACRLAMHLGSPTRKSVKSILESGRDLRPASATEPLALELPAHGNVRGPGYYH